jgi:putative intracellular protease/amidase
MKNRLKIILWILIVTAGLPTVAQMKKAGGKPANIANRILMVVSSYGKDSGKIRPGYEFDEFTQAWLVFKANGFTMEVASPKGGPTEPDEFNKTKLYNKTVLADKIAMAALKNTIPTVRINPADYTAVYIVGGKGAMFDLPFDPSLQDIISYIYNKKNAVVSAVCHGPAAFVNVKTDGKKYLLEGKTVTGFCNVEEEKFGKKWVKDFPFLLEDKLRSRNAVYEQAEIMLPHVIVSGNLVTGQNPYSTAWLAEEVVKALGRQPVKRTLYTDENSMFLVKKAITGEFEWAKAELSKNKPAYDIELIAVYGYYRLIDEKASNKETQLALNIIELATPYMYKDVLELERAKGYIKLGEKEKAKIILQALVKKEPTMEKAVALLKEAGAE